MRLPRLGAAALLTAALALAGCSSPSQEPAAAPSAAPDGAYPVTLTHLYGSTTIPAKPQRIVAVGFNEADFVLALGEKPVGQREVLGSFDADGRSWAQAALGGTQPEKVGGSEIDFERVAGLRPDLILGVYSFMEQADYDRLSAIAPTVAQPDEDGATWQEQTLTTGQALGKEAEAQQVVADTEKRFADARAAHPEFAGKTVTVALWGVDSGLYALEPTDLRAKFYADLGFTPSALTGAVAPESYGQLEADVVVVMGGTREDLAGQPTFQGLPAAQQNRVVYTGGFDTQLNGALGFGSPLSLPVAIDLAVPRLAAAADGNPANPTD
ncbi:iron-siderophore ABC transporter substrate-binding protein [Pseudonocardia pini]|uniref:iron-siderophore ABC transporter substrate-binding protein n=1 Tax=Pseudonocardia pini TaxID=2758030 RepID=UPI0015F0390F|nr:iron-siderophore ABC transporter substrate-binding protein [Pseudonocardia pini]